MRCLCCAHLRRRKKSLEKLRYDRDEIAEAIGIYGVWSWSNSSANTPFSMKEIYICLDIALRGVWIGIENFVGYQTSK
jgi:hypothetical protein